jgi:hypothetical protein
MANDKSKKDDSEHFPNYVKVGDKYCIGCTRWDMDILICYSDGRDIHDIFLTEKQAVELAMDLLRKTDSEKLIREFKLDKLLNNLK